MMTSPASTTSLSHALEDERLRRRRRRGGMMPAVFVFRSRPRRHWSRSSSVTRELRRDTRVTRPTRPAAVTIGSLTWTRAFEPAAISTCCSTGPACGRACARPRRCSHWEAGPLPKTEQPPQLGVLAYGRLVLDRLLTEALDLGAELLVLRTRRRGRPRPRRHPRTAAPRARRRDLERVDDGRARVLDAVQRPARRSPWK